MTLGLRPVISTRCSFISASGRVLEAYTVLNVCSCCSERTVRTRGPLSEFERFVVPPPEVPDPPMEVELLRAEFVLLLFPLEPFLFLIFEGSDISGGGGGKRVKLKGSDISVGKRVQLEGSDISVGKRVQLEGSDMSGGRELNLRGLIYLGGEES